MTELFLVVSAVAVLLEEVERDMARRDRQAAVAEAESVSALAQRKSAAAAATAVCEKAAGTEEALRDALTNTEALRLGWESERERGKALAAELAGVLAARDQATELDASRLRALQRTIAELSLQEAEVRKDAASTVSTLQAQLAGLTDAALLTETAMTAIDAHLAGIHCELQSLEDPAVVPALVVEVETTREPVVTAAVAQAHETALAVLRSEAETLRQELARKTVLLQAANASIISLQSSRGEMLAALLAASGAKAAEGVEAGSTPEGWTRCEDAGSKRRREG